MAAGHQLRLLLWKDYLIRKRKWVTLAGVSWAIAVVFCLYLVRVNVDNQDLPTCQYPARALPSAGLLTFLQSFVCSVNNDCSPMDRFQEIPTYDDSKFTQLQRQFSPLLYNETVLDVASTAPDALKLLATLADVIDQPTFVDITLNGMKVGDLFTNPNRVKRYLSSEMDVPQDVMESVMSSELILQGLFKESIDRCNTRSISSILSMSDADHLEVFVQQLCSLSNADVEKIATKLIMEVNFQKYISMIGDMWYKLAGDKWLTQLGDMMTAITRMARLESFLPREIVALFLNDDVDFNYFTLNIITSWIDVFESTFGDTLAYQTLRDAVDGAATGLRYLDRLVTLPADRAVGELASTDGDIPTEVLTNAAAAFGESNANDSSLGVFNVITQMTKIIYKFLPGRMKSDVSFFSTLLAKLMEGAVKVIDINMHIQEMAYNVSLRNTEGVKVLIGLPTHIVEKGFEALADAERTQILTSELDVPGQMFCNTTRIANFFVISNTEADSLKKQLCSNAWKNYITDLIQSFGIYEVKDNINVMASIVIQNMMGKDISERLYSMDKIMNILQNFTTGLTQIRAHREPDVDWRSVFHVADDSAFMRAVTAKGHLGKQMLITVHGALAKEVIAQNLLLEYKISPFLIDMSTVVRALLDQLRLMPADLALRLKEQYPQILQTMLFTMLDEQKTYKSLSTPGTDIACHGADAAAAYLSLPPGAERGGLVPALCDAATLIDSGLRNNSALAKAIWEVSNRTRSGESVDWTELIDGVKALYVKLSADLPYLFEYDTYGMDGDTQTKVKQMLRKAKEFWFGLEHIHRSLHLSVKLVLRLLDLMDQELFNITTETWRAVKRALGAAAGPISIVNDVIIEVTALVNNKTYTPRLPSKISLALAAVVPSVPRLIVDFVDVIVSDDTDIEPIITLMNSDPAWPCSATSMSEYMQLNDSSKTAVKGFETLICLDTELQQQWKDYIDLKNMETRRVFLKFSSSFDLFVEDVGLLTRTLIVIFKSHDLSNTTLTLFDAWKYVVDVINGTDKDTFGKIFSKIDTVLSSVNTTALEGQSTNSLWEEFIRCSNGTMINASCSAVGRAAWKYSLESLSVMLENMADDLMTYFREVNAPDSNLLQMLGFTKRTGVYILYDRLPELVGVLLNSYWDYGFMSQIRRASLSPFWDCETLLAAVLPLPGSGIDDTTIQKVKPVVCPTLLHWISLPRGDNTLLDLFAKPQYFFYTLPVQNLTSNYKSAFTKATELASLLKDIANKNETRISEDDIHINNLEDKLRRTVDTILTYRINDTDPSYRLFNEINTKQFYAVVYLTRIVATINKISISMDNITVTDLKSDISDADLKKLNSELSSIQKIFKRRPSDAVGLFFDVITDVIWRNNDDYKLNDALDAMCDDLNNNNTNKDILNEGDRTKRQVCAKNYRLFYGAVENLVTEDKEQIRSSLLNLVHVLQNGGGEVKDIFTFLKQRKQLMRSLKYSTKYAYELGLPVYLKYLQNNLENYNVVLVFLTGEDWWSALRALYSGPHVSSFFDAVEKSFEIAEDILTKLDRIHLVRLLRDMEVNNSTSVCAANVTLSEYLPDGTGALADVWRRACGTDRLELFTEIPALVFASQGYDSKMKLNKEIDQPALDAVIIKTESKLELIKDGPKSPRRPAWMTDGKIARLRTVALQLLSKETLTKIAFGLTANVVDAGTLLLNSSNFVLCSEMTTWLKQINLQLIKKQEYDNLLCHLHSMTLEDVHHALNNDFHWDITLRELISSRNYTKYEMNKSMGELLEQVKLHLLEDLTANSTKLSECLARNVSRNPIGNATLLVTVLGHTARLIQAELPHLHEVDGIKNVPYLKKLSTEVAHKLDAWAPLKKYLVEKNLSRELEKHVDKSIVKAIKEGDINLREIPSYRNTPIEKYITLRSHSWNTICKQHDCKQISNIVYRSLNKTLVEKDLPKLQSEKFWRFDFVSNIINHSEVVVGHLARLLGLVSKLDVAGARKGNLAAVIDLVMGILNDDTLSGIVFSVQGIVGELRPLLYQSPLERDLEAVADGLLVLQKLKRDLLENNDLKVEVSALFVDPEQVESSLTRLGINNTNFWSIAAPRIHAGYLNLKPMFSATDGEYRVSRFVCQPEWSAAVLAPGALDVVSAEDVAAALVDQLCLLDDRRAKQMLVALMHNLNYSYIIDKVITVVLLKLYSASNLTQLQGSVVLDSLPQIAELLPTVQASVGELSDTLTEEPVFLALKNLNFSSVGNLISSSEFMSSAGNMVCGKPFSVDVSHLYKSVIQAEDMSDQPSQAQLDVLPTDFCRSLYTEIINMEGGKIVWSFVKPLIMGRILYTPDSPPVRRIIQKANGTFAHMIKLTGLIHSFARAFSSVDKLAEHRAGVSVLKRLISSPTFSELKSSLVGDQLLPDVDVDGLFDEFGDLKGVGSLLMKASDLLRCINLNRFQAMQDEYQLTHTAAQLSMVNEFSAGLVFLKSEEHEGVPTNVEYKIRMDIDNVPTTARIRNFMWTPGPEGVFIENMRYFRGFIQIQDMIDRAIIELSKNTPRRDKREASPDDDTKWAVYTQQMPYPCYRKDIFQTGIYESQALLVAFFFSLLYTVASAIRFMVIDKESGNTMLMSVMGVDLNYHTLSWFIASFVEMTITCACIAAVLWFGNILPKTAPSLVFALLFIFGISVLCFCYLVSKLFSSASFGAVCGAVVYLVTFMPIVLILSLEAAMSSSYKIFVCLSMSSALCYSFLYISRFEAMGQGARWADWWSSPVEEGSHMNIGTAALMMVADAALYLAAGWLLDRCFGPRTLRSSITDCVTTSEKAGVSVVNISKVYNEGSRRAKLALDNVSIELQKGQITTLLGHNGAGKTTLIKILTGMLKPSKGHVTIRSDGACGARLGVCPQRDVLFEYMTAREHVALYAQLKSGLPLEHVADEVESLLRVLSLGPVCMEPVCRLSGGTRRRLCVALAFVARPQLVSLDEPTSGVDPAARRDIWSMIVKLREDRTVLLTTHHLDEAELLSDQIVIMHKGQVHTTGSPIDIKRTLGTGYTLTATYPRRSQETWVEDEEVTLEERSKQLLAAVRGVVHNASLDEISGDEVEITLPFFDANGLSNNYVELCTTLEARQEALAFSSYSMECSTLEQVFFNICREADRTRADGHGAAARGSEDTPSKSASSSSIRIDNAPLVESDGPLKGTAWQQFLALMYGRYIHYKRNRWLLFLVAALPALFVAVAMAFSMIRPPADNEHALPLTAHLYQNTTRFLVPVPSVVNSTADPGFARRVMDTLRSDGARNWTQLDSPVCRCAETKQVCDADGNLTRTDMMLLPDVDHLNKWIVESHDLHIEKRYGGFSSSLKNNITNLVAWYNNKGHHAMPAFLNAVNVAVLRATTGRDHNITTYTHPLKISKEQISKDTIYQHVADAGISALVLIAYCLVSAGSAIYLVTARKSQEKRLQLLCGVSPLLYWTTALVWDMIIIILNMLITALILAAFQFPVFVARDNLPAICLLILLYGYASSCLIHLLEKLFTEPSVANMILFCGCAFLGLAGLALLLILDIISQSDATDNARRILHKVFLLSPQFALGDGMLEIAKNTIQAQVLGRFGMDTYRGPFSSALIAYHCLALVVVGTALLLLNLAIEYDLFEGILLRFRSESIVEELSGEMEDLEVAAERKRVETAVQHAADAPVRLHTIGNINAGFVDTEDGSKRKSVKRIVSGSADVAQCVGLGKAYSALAGTRVAVRNLTLGIPYGQCTALLGQNGAGKSTTFSMLTGETRPTTGQIYLNDRPASARDLCRGLISYCPQSDAVDPLMSAREILTMYCRLRGIAGENDVIRRTLDSFELTKYADMLSGALSGGNKRKLCAAVAFMGRSPLVLLDEPTSGTDPMYVSCVSRSVARACSSRRGVLLSTHALQHARRLAARVALVRAGRLCALAPLDSCLHRFGGGFVVQCRGSPRALWRQLSARAPHARLRVMHHAALHVLLPSHAVVDGKEVRTRASYVFRLMSELQGTGHLDDYAVNQSSLDQMFLSFTDKADVDLETIDVEPLPSPRTLKKNTEETTISSRMTDDELRVNPEISKIKGDICPEILSNGKIYKTEVLRNEKPDILPEIIIGKGESHSISSTILVNGENQTGTDIVRKHSEPSPSTLVSIYKQTSSELQRRNSEELSSMTSL